MSTLFEGVSISGIVKPGQAYMLFGNDCGNVEGEIDLMYFISSEEELLKTLEMEMQVVLGYLFQVTKFIGVEQVTDDRHVFRIVCSRNGEPHSNRSLYLHRLKRYPEMLIKMKQIFSDDENQLTSSIG